LRRAPGGFGLGQLPIARRPSATTRMVCGFCSTGCGLDIHLRDGAAVNLSPSATHPVNLGMACSKGWEALAPLDAADRATTPLLRDDHGRLQAIDWPTALDLFCGRLQAIQSAHGPASVAFISSGQIVTEEIALLGALARSGMDIVHGDSNTRQCMATSAVAYKEAFGFDAPPYTYDDFEQSDVIVLVGSNLCIAHPIMWERILRNPHRPEIVVIDPRRTETAMAATIHVSLQPKSDLTLLYGLANTLIDRGAIDGDFVSAHTVGFESFARHVRAFTAERVEAESGVPRDHLERLGSVIEHGRAVSFWWTMGVNQSHEGVRTAQAIVDLALLTGNIGRPGTGANSITGQCNAMGSRLFANTTNLLGGHDFTNPAHRHKVASVLQIDEARIPREPSWPYDRIVEGIVRGEIRGLWVIGTNSAHSWINQRGFHELLDRLDFLVVQDMFHSTETAQRAHLVLPAAGWGEKEGTFINSERRLGLVKRVHEAPGQALADFWIFKAIAEAWGCGELFRRWTDPEAVFAILQELSEGQPCDITGVRGYDEVDDGHVQWPMAAGERERVLAEGPQRRLFADGRFFTPDQRARFLWEAPVAPREVPSDRRPLVLLTGRGSASQWHTGTRTGKSAVLAALAPADPYVEIHPDDAEARRIATGDWVIVTSVRGSVQARAHVVPTVGSGQVFMPMHDAATNRLTFPAFDPYSRQPSYKYSAVEVHRAQAWELDRHRAG
jgi:assimilatory nitrate reductase catalytic subunit